MKMEKAAWDISDGGGGGVQDGGGGSRIGGVTTAWGPR